MQLSVAYSFLPKQNSVAASQVMDHFGISFEQGLHVIADGLELPIAPGQVVLFTGASGSGKSSLMRAAGRELVRATMGESGPSSTSGNETRRNGDQATGGQGAQEPRSTDLPLSPRLPVPLSTCPSGASSYPSAPSSRQFAGGVLNLDELSLPASLLIDSLSLPAAEAMQLLSTCGLGEAHLMLRTPTELSDGQRYRFRLALALAQQPQWIIADEFTATLDRTLAKVIAFNIRRLADRHGVGFLLATTHEDVAADLRPDLHVRCRLDGDVRVERRREEVPGGQVQHDDRQGDQATGRQGDVIDGGPLVPPSPSPLVTSAPVPSPLKKKVPGTPSHSLPNSGFPQRPVATGRTSLGGITAAITSG